MKILALDAATSVCSVALWDGGAQAHRLQSTEHGHAAVLMPMVLDVLAEAGWRFADLDLLAVTVGPGAFTGLRIGLAAARGMMLAADLPCVGVTTLEAVAEAVNRDARAHRALLVVLDSKRGDVYAQGFSAAGDPLGPPVAVAPSRLVELVPRGVVLVAGDAAATALGALAEAGVEAATADVPGHPTAAAVAAIAARRWSRGEPARCPLSPLYLRSPAIGRLERGQPSRS